MSKPLSILYVASEADPFIKTGSIGDIAGSLPKWVKSMGHDIRVMLPGYSSINNRRFQIHNLLRMKDIEIPLAGGMEHANIKSSYLNGDNEKVLVYFISNDRYFSRDGLYSDPLTKKQFVDNDERFIFFCRGVIETLKRLQWQPDIIHCNDWQCGLIPAYLKSLYKNDSYFKNVRTVFTVYSLASHGTFPKTSYAKTGMPDGLLNGHLGDRLNFLNAGLLFADTITTFGSKAEKGIKTDPQNGMGELLQSRRKSIVAMNESTTESGQEILAGKFVDVYREMTKNG